ncbi:MAG: hypothetical protein ABJD66_00145 [Cellulophaga sp.]|uniref:hypothetical protein n=1 Tax=Cellulophaga sp. TaxID=1972202 RepID=UPI003267CFBA
MKLKHTLSLILLAALFFTSCKDRQYASNIQTNYVTKSKGDIFMSSRIELLEDTIRDLKKEVASLTSYKSKVVSGKLIFGVEVATFQPCGSDKIFWITDNSKETGKLEKLYYALTNGKDPYSPIYAKIEIIDKGKDKYGFAADYNGTYEYVNVLEVRHIKSSDCK